jgi:ferric-dicitrate binding protein FerR (iron transport regulator)
MIQQIPAGRTFDHDGQERVPQGHSVSSRSPVEHASQWSAPGTLVFLMVIAHMMAPAHIRGCAADPGVSGGTRLLDELAITVTPHSRVAIHRKEHALHVHLFSGTIMFSRPGSKVRSLSIPTIVTTENLRLVHIDAEVCVRVQSERTSVMVLSGTVGLSMVNSEDLGGNEMELRAGDRAEVFRSRAGLVFRLENGSGGWSECDLT